MYGAQDPLQLLDIHVISVAQRSVHIKADGADARNLQGHEELPVLDIRFMIRIVLHFPYNTDMATWITHLRIAENLLSQLPDLEPARCAVGNIAPDSGIPDEKWEKFTPPTEVTHFSKSPDAFGEIADLEFYRHYLLPLRGGEDPGLISFRIGYFFHLITDNLWSEKIGVPTAQRFSAAFAMDKDFIWKVKKDWYGLDFIYVRDHPNCLFWRVFLDAQPESGELDFLPLESVRQRVAYIQQYYQRTDEDVQKAYNRSYDYLSGPEMDRFVDESTWQLSRIYQQLWINGAVTDGFVSALDLSI